MTGDMIFTSESVTMGHPDKLCDRISDAAIDAYLRQDAGARAIVECAVATGVVFLAARFAADAIVDLPSVARMAIAEAGYTGPQFNARNCSILTNIAELPFDTREPLPATVDDATIERGVAHDQANVFGYACRETPELMPLPITLAHRIARAIDDTRRNGLHWLSPDAKTQVTVEYRRGMSTRIHGISLMVAVDPDLAGVDVEDRLRQLAFDVLSGGPTPDAQTSVSVLTGEHYDVGGPARHAGLTGRKNGIDTYGEIARQSGAALSGKDPSRIDRIGAYAARHAAKNVVAAGLAERCEVHLAYTIGQAKPLSLSVETFGTGKKPDEEIARRVAAILDFRPLAISHRFGLRTRPLTAGEGGFYRQLSAYGHFGRTDIALPWEATDAADALRG